jgi:hypothetical protein
MQFTVGQRWDTGYPQSWSVLQRLEALIREVDSIRLALSRGAAVSRGMIVRRGRQNFDGAWDKARHILFEAANTDPLAKEALGYLATLRFEVTDDPHSQEQCNDEVDELAKVLAWYKSSLEVGVSAPPRSNRKIGFIT